VQLGNSAAGLNEVALLPYFTFYPSRIVQSHLEDFTEAFASYFNSIYLFT